MGTRRDEEHLDWSAKQSRILTDGGKANEHYSKENGYPFTPSELPHYHLRRGDSHDVFRGWATGIDDGETRRVPFFAASRVLRCPVVGVWGRPLFAGSAGGRFEFSTNETVYNIQTNGLFVDLRVPTTQPKIEAGKRSGGATTRQVLESLNDEELKLLARQHIFAGYTLLTREGSETTRPIATRHHCIDWNYLPGKPRPRPNKWFVEVGDKNANVWRETSYATDENGQSYYFELWERIPSDEPGFRLAIRKRANASGFDEADGIIVALGDHFNYILGRQFTGGERTYPSASSTVELVDMALDSGDRESAISYLTINGGHGRISTGWKIDCSVHPWLLGNNVFRCLDDTIDVVRVNGKESDPFGWSVIIGSSVWEVYECSLSSPEQLEIVLNNIRKDDGPRESRL